MKMEIGKAFCFVFQIDFQLSNLNLLFIQIFEFIFLFESFGEEIWTIFDISLYFRKVLN